MAVRARGSKGRRSKLNEPVPGRTIAFNVAIPFGYTPMPPQGPVSGGIDGAAADGA